MRHDKETTHSPVTQNYITQSVRTTDKIEKTEEELYLD
jgi:hypothetical protein